jgi:c-di-GMP-binding flagellar brake protein YcgR
MVMTKEQETRRAFPRRRLNNVEMFCYRSSPSHAPQMRRNIGQEIVDISQGGARVRVSEPISRGEALTLELRDRNSGESFRARGEVRWASAAGVGHTVGVQFNEHYTPVGLREQFTVGVETAVAPKPAKKLEESDIMLTPVEKRKAIRFSVQDYVITVFRQGTLAAQGLKRNLGRRVLDISQSGAQLELSETLEPGTLILLSLHFNSLSDSFEALAAVRWTRPDAGVAGGSYRAGLQFLNLGDSQRKMIEFMRKWFSKSRKK